MVPDRLCICKLAAFMKALFAVFRCDLVVARVFFVLCRRPGSRHAQSCEGVGRALARLASFQKGQGFDVVGLREHIER